MANWELEVQNRLLIGPNIGFSIYVVDEDYDYSEFILYLVFISIHLKWET